MCNTTKMCSAEQRLTTRQAAKYVKLSPRTLERYRSIGGGPRYLTAGYRVFYCMDALDEWLIRGTRTSTSDPGPDGRTRKRRPHRRRREKAAVREASKSGRRRSLRARLWPRRRTAPARR